MPSLRPLTDVARTDAKFFADSVVPAIAAAGFDGSVALLVTDAPDACVGDVVAADIVIEGSQSDIEALLAGKQKTELNALDKLKAAKRSADASAGGVVVRGTLDALRAFIAAVAPREKNTSGAKDVASEKGAVPQAKQVDTMRLPNGRLVKGRAGGKRAPAAAAPASAPKTSVVGAQKGGATDRVAFAVQNVAGFINAGIARIEESGSGSGASDDDGAKWILGVGEVRRG